MEPPPWFERGLLACSEGGRESHPRAGLASLRVGPPDEVLLVRLGEALLGLEASPLPLRPPRACSKASRAR
jgi:hypothetical protein